MQILGEIGFQRGYQPIESTCLLYVKIIQHNGATLYHIRNEMEVTSMLMDYLIKKGCFCVQSFKRHRNSILDIE